MTYLYIIIILFIKETEIKMMNDYIVNIFDVFVIAWYLWVYYTY